MVAIDSNILLRWLVRDSPELASSADELIYSSQDGRLLIDRLVLAEVCYVLSKSYGHTKDEVSANLRVILSQPQFFVVDRELVTDMINIFAKERPLSPEDSWLLALKRAGKVRGVHTFDAALRKRLS